MTTESRHQERTIIANIDESAIKRVSSFFNAGAEDILNEALQNSRRSRATAVHITNDDNNVRITDDGTGIADPQTILSFGRTDWTNDQTRDEHPAGMGMYALARLDPVTIASKTADQPAWSVDLMPRHFTGEAPATVVDADDDLFPAGHGTIITFDWPTPIERDIKKATEYYPIPVLHNGEPCPQKDFLVSAQHIQEWEGLRIGVYYSNDWITPSMTGRTNFHGIYVWNSQTSKLVSTMSPYRTYGVRIDVVDCSELELTLPARRELVQTPFIDRMKQAALSAIYTAIAEDPNQPGVSYAAQQEAATMGITILDPKPTLPTWEPTNRYEDEYDHYRQWVPATRESLIVSQHLGIQEEHTLSLAIENTPDTPQLLHEQDEKLAGYVWYDDIPRITAIVTDLQYGDDVIRMTTDTRQLPHQRPDEIRVTAHIRQPDGAEHEITMSSQVAFPNNDETIIEDLTPVITKDSDITSYQMADLMMPAYFRYSDDYDSDSHETQEEWAQQTILHQMQTLLESQETAIRNAVTNAVFSTGIRSMPVGTQLTITVQSEGRISTTIVLPPTDVD